MTHQNIFRFAVGTQGGPKSSVWNISWTGADLYLMARDLMGNRKISLHKSSCRTYAFLDDDKAATARQQSGFPGSTRRIREWRQPSREVENGVIHELNIIIPTDDVWPAKKGIQPIPSAPQGMATEIDICMPHNPSLTARLHNSFSIGPGCLSYQHIPITDGAKDSIEEFRKMIAAWMQSKSIVSPHSYRVISEPVALKEHVEGGGPRVIYELSVRRTLTLLSVTADRKCKNSAGSNFT